MCWLFNYTQDLSKRLDRVIRGDGRLCYSGVDNEYDNDEASNNKNH